MISAAIVTDNAELFGDRHLAKFGVEQKDSIPKCEESRL